MIRINIHIDHLGIIRLTSPYVPLIGDLFEFKNNWYIVNKRKFVILDNADEIIAELSLSKC